MNCFYCTAPIPAGATYFVVKHHMHPVAQPSGKVPPPVRVGEACAVCQAAEIALTVPHVAAPNNIDFTPDAFAVDNFDYDPAFSKGQMYTHSQKLLFGKYKGMRISEVLQGDPDYLVWLLKNVDHFHMTDGTLKNLSRQLAASGSNKRFRWQQFARDKNFTDEKDRPSYQRPSHTQHSDPLYGSQGVMPSLLGNGEGIARTVDGNGDVVETSLHDMRAHYLGSPDWCSDEEATARALKEQCEGCFEPKTDKR